MKMPKSFEGFDAEVFLQKCIAEDKFNGEKYAEKHGKYQLALKLVGEVFGTTSTEYRYLRQHRPIMPFSAVATTYPKVLKRYQRYVQDKESRERRAQSRLNRIQAAVDQLAELGYHEGKQYPRSAAPEFLRKVSRAHTANANA